MPELAEPRAESVEGSAQVADELVGASPEPTPVLKDRHGSEFDPSLHRVGKDGTPLLSARGRLQRKPGVKPGGASRVGAVGGTGPEIAQPSEAVKQAAQDALYKTNARVTVQSLVTVCVMLGGDDWKPSKRNGLDEHEAMVDAWTEYYRVRGVTDVPPEVMVVAATGIYVLPRIDFRALWSKYAHPDSGDNGERKDAPGSAARGPILNVGGGESGAGSAHRS